MPSSEILRQLSGVMFFCRMRYLALPVSSLVSVSTGMPSSGDRSAAAPATPTFVRTPSTVLTYSGTAVWSTVTVRRSMLEARIVPLRSVIEPRSAGSGMVAVREDWASLDTAEASKPCSRNSWAPKMLKMNSTATVMVRIRRRGLDAVEADLAAHRADAAAGPVAGAARRRPTRRWRPGRRGRACRAVGVAGFAVLVGVRAACVASSPAAGPALGCGAPGRGCAAHPRDRAGRARATQAGAGLRGGCLGSASLGTSRPVAGVVGRWRSFAGAGSWRGAARLVGSVAGFFTGALVVVVLVVVLVLALTLVTVVTTEPSGLVTTTVVVVTSPFFVTRRRRARAFVFGRPRPSPTVACGAVTTVKPRSFFAGFATPRTLPSDSRRNAAESAGTMPSLVARVGEVRRGCAGRRWPGSGRPGCRRARRRWTAGCAG